jgi:hypothetical protein
MAGKTNSRHTQCVTCASPARLGQDSLARIQRFVQGGAPAA